MPVVIDGTTGITTPSVTNSGASTLSAGTANGVAYLNGSKVLTTGSALQFDGTNLGLGVTPSAWGSGRLAFQIAGSAANYFMGANANSLVFGSNFFSDGTNNKYIANGFASAYIQASSQHLWYTAASGTAGNAITFTQAMTLDASGNLGIGTSSPEANGRLTLDRSGSNYLMLRSGGVNRMSLYVDSGVSAVDAQANPLFFYAGSAERARITTAGEFWVAGTADQGAYNIQCNGTGVWGAGAYVNGSDARIKDDIKPLQSSLSVVQNLNPVTFRYKESWSKDTSVQPGFIAQELQQALAGQDYIDGVVMQGSEYMSVAYQTLIPVLTKAIQEQQALIEQLTTRIAALEAK